MKPHLCSVSACAAPLAKGAIFRGLRLCVSCRNQLATYLSGLPQLYQACELTLEVPRPQSIKMVRGRRLTGIRLDDETVAVRSNTIGVLSSWCELVVAERRVPGPISLDARMLTSFLQVHLDWLTAHAVAADFACEIAGLVAAVRKVLNPSQVRTMDIAPCPRDGCGQMIRASISTVQRRSAPRVCCAGGHTWQPREWLDLRRRSDLADGGVLA